MKGEISPVVRISLLIFGSIETFGAVIWCAAGAGIYGSPLVGMSGSELAHVWAFLLIGPMSALPASILLSGRPRWGAAWLIASGLASGALAVPFMNTDASFIPFLIVSLPMLVAGLWLFRESANEVGSWAFAGPPLKQGERPDFHGQMYAALSGLMLFLVGLIVTYALIIGLAVLNIFGLMGAPLPGNPLVNENEELAYGVVVLLVAVLVGLMTFARNRLRLRAAFVAGMWLAILLGGLIIWIR